MFWCGEYKSIVTKSKVNPLEEFFRYCDDLGLSSDEEKYEQLIKEVEGKE